MHEGRQLVHTILPINVDTLLNLIFSKSKFLVDFHLIRKTTDMVHRDWVTNEEGLKQRTVTLTVALTQAVGPKCSHVRDTFSSLFIIYYFHLNITKHNLLYEVKFTRVIEILCCFTITYILVEKRVSSYHHILEIGV